ncbi:MAG: InlB B-repeat-containing protein, partial [Clostridiales bacterium]|nr:InlB B-repeat-containing protein [Clostridiales bacterium]
NYTVPISTNGVIYFVKFLKEVNFTASTGGVISPAGIRTLQQGENVDVVATVATGYSFSEFLLTGIPASDLVPNSANPNQAVFTMGTAGGTVHAVFAPNTYTVKFNPNGDNVENLPENISATYDVAFSIPSTIPTRDGYVFKYWCTKNVDDGTGIGYSAGTTNLKNLVSENGGEYNFYAIWTVNKYTVSFNANKGSSVAPFMMDYGANFSFPNTVRTGYTFGGWFDNPEFTGTGHAIGSSATVTGNITYHAKWLNNKYTVTFNENGGYNAPSPITAYYDTAFDIPVITPEKMGHTFLGWDNQPTSQEIVYFAGDTGIINLSLGGDPSAAMVPNINLYAVWRVNSYIITWNLAGGSIAGSTQNPQTTVVYGQNYVLPSGTPVRTGYTFTGWYTSSGQGGTLINEGTTVNVTVSSTHYAHWSVNTYTVVFDKNDSAATGTMDPLICTYGIPFSLPLNEYAKTGFRFDGWALSTTGEPVYSNGDEVFQSLTTGNDVTVTLYAKWIPNRFILTFNSNGGTGSMSAMQIEFNSSVVLPTNKFTKSGYTFMGWATSFADAQAGNATYTNGASYTMRTTGATLYAVWSSNPYNVTFYGNGNDGDSSMGVQIMSFGQTANLNRNTYRRTGYSFIGWSTSPGIATVVYNDEASVTMNTQGINLYAQWQPNLYTISYNANTSDMTVINIPSSQNAVYDTAINLSSMIPQRTGYSFAGWARVSTAIVSEFSVGQAVTNLTSTHNEDVILYALWSPNVYEVIWALRGGSISGSPQSVVNSVNYNGTYVFPETNPIRTGYVFNGWFSSTAPNATQIIASTTHTTTISRTIYAKWTPITYYVVYNKNAFDAIGTMEKSIHSYDDSNTQIAQNAFTRPGHNFVGWALSADGEVE